MYWWLALQPVRTGRSCCACYQRAFDWLKQILGLTLSAPEPGPLLEKAPVLLASLPTAEPTTVILVLATVAILLGMSRSADPAALAGAPESRSAPAIVASFNKLAFRWELLRICSWTFACKAGGMLMARAWRRLGLVLGQGLPHVQDVGAAPFDVPFDGVWLPTWFIGTDGSLWRVDLTGGSAQQVPSPGDLTRIAVSPDGSIWCADARGRLWTMRGETWSEVNVFTEKVKDLAIAADGTVYLVMAQGRYYSILPDGLPFYHGVWVPIEAITGIGRPNADHPYGQAWGVSALSGPGALWHCSTINGWSPTNIRDVAHLSLGQDGTLWLVKTNGTIWATHDGGATQVRVGGKGATRIAGGFHVGPWSVSWDGGAWLLEDVKNEDVKNDVLEPSPLPRPPLPPPQPQGLAPTIGVSATGGGTGTIFKVTGSNFVPKAQVTIRGARIGDGQIHQFYWSARSDDEGDLIPFDIPLPCVPGLVINFSANDGRHNPADLTERLWSNTVPASCPPG